MTTDEYQSGFWQRLRDFAQRVRIDSVKVGPATLRFEARGAADGCFASITAKLTSTVGRPNDVLVISAHNVDEVTVVDAISADHECEALQPLEIHPGGSGANTASALSLLGLKVEIAGSVGDDPDGDLLLASLTDAGVGVGLVNRVSQALSGRTQNIVDLEGRRLLVVRPNANDRFATDAEEASLVHAVESARVLHLSSFVDEGALVLQTRLAVVAATAGTVVTLTPGALYARRGLDRLEDLIGSVDILFLYREQLVTLIEESSARVFLTGDAMQDQLTAYFAWKLRRSIHRPQVVVVKDPLSNSSGTLGQRFLAAACGGSELERFFYPRELPRGVEIRAVDTTGAGDAAAAGFLVGVLRGGSLEESLDASFLLACFASSAIGARSALGTSDHSAASVMLEGTTNNALGNG